jgi:hypothetical protein
LRAVYARSASQEKEIDAAGDGRAVALRRSALRDVR